MKTTRALLRYLSLPLLLMGACAGPPGEFDDEVTTQAALQPDAGLLPTTPLLPVIDIILAGGRSITELDGVPEAEAKDFGGGINVYEMPGSVTTGTLPNVAIVRRTPLSWFQNGISIKRRGSSSAYWPKKNYSLTLNGAHSVLGMPANSEWVMHSCYSDKSCLRNYIGYWQAAKIFPWAPRVKFAEVFINDQYRGIYLMVEKIVLDPQRVNHPFNPADTQPDISFVIKRDGNDTNHWPWDLPDWVSSSSPTTPAQKTAWYYASPKPNSQQKTFLKDFMNNTFEPMFTQGNSKYAPANFAQVMDQGAAVDFMIIQEMSNNVDAYWKSMYLTKPKGGKVFMGPIWDLDLAFSNYNPDPKACAFDNWRVVSAPNFQPLAELWKLKGFRQAFKDRWSSLRNVATVSRTAFDDELTRMSAYITNAMGRDERVWGRFSVAPVPSWTECSVTARFGDEVAALKTWIRSRIDWMDSKVLNDPNFAK